MENSRIPNISEPLSLMLITKIYFIRNKINATNQNILYKK